MSFVLLGMQAIVTAVVAEFISAESKVAMPATRRWIMPRPLLDRTAVRPHPAKLRKLFFGDDTPVLKVMYLFAGRQRHSDIGSFLKKASQSKGFRLELMEFDIERSPEHDLTDEKLWERIGDLLKGR